MKSGTNVKRDFRFENHFEKQEILSRNLPWTHKLWNLVPTWRIIMLPNATILHISVKGWVIENSADKVILLHHTPPNLFVNSFVGKIEVAVFLCFFVPDDGSSFRKPVKFYIWISIFTFYASVNRLIAWSWWRLIIIKKKKLFLTIIFPL